MSDNYELEHNTNIETPLRQMMSRYPFIEGIFAATADGVPIVKVISPESTIDLQSNESDYPICFSVASEYASHISIGELKSFISVHRKYTYLLIYERFLVVTVVARTGNEGLLNQITPQLYASFISLSHEVENPTEMESNAY
ncbi:hypothetical protein WA158_000170 [Blastocystis sp. Blastoise]